MLCFTSSPALASVEVSEAAAVVSSIFGITILVKIAYGVTSEPVPAVVGTAATVRALFAACLTAASVSYKKSAFFSGLAIISAIALEASMGEPPPIPITKSTFSESPKAVARITVSTEGFSSIPSKITYGTCSRFSASSTSCREPFTREECFPVTSSAFVPSSASSWLCCRTQPFSL